MIQVNNVGGKIRFLTKNIFKYQILRVDPYYKFVLRLNLQVNQSLVWSRKNTNRLGLDRNGHI
jgi:hypothetical protein